MAPIGFFEVGLNNIGNIATIIGICLLIGAMAKSTQIGLHVSLPCFVSAYSNGVYGLVIMLMFLLALTLGFELGKKHYPLIADKCLTYTLNQIRLV